jgi:hypothetical protein
MEEVDLNSQYEPSLNRAPIRSEGTWPRRQIIKLFLIGIALTLTTNFPSAFTHTSVNTAFVKVNEYLNNSYVEREVELEKQHYIWLRSIIGSR